VRRGLAVELEEALDSLREVGRRELHAADELPHPLQLEAREVQAVQRGEDGEEVKGRVDEMLYSSDSASGPDVSESGLPPVNPYRYRADWGISRLCSVDLKCKSGENYIIRHESTWRPYARNGKHFGLGQLSASARYKYLPRHPGTTDPIYQLYATRRYIVDRYHTTAAAVAWWMKHGWY
jgi:hypothetical protein